MECEIVATYNESGPSLMVKIVDDVYQARLEEAAEQEPAGDDVLNYSIATGPGQTIHKPIHENITLASLIEGKIIEKDTTFASVVGGKLTHKIPRPEIFEFIRGVIWNDNSLCYFFDNDLDSNSYYKVPSK